MFSRVFLCLLLFAATAYSQPVYPPPPKIDPPDVVIAASADGHTLAIARSSGGSAKRYGRIELWNTQSGELQRTITGFDGPIWSMAFSKDGKSVLTVSTEYRNEKIQNSVRRRDDIVTAELKWWDTESGEFVKRLPLGEEGVSSVEASWAPFGDVLALVERYSRRQLAPMETPGGFGPQRIVSGWIYVEDLYLRLLDAESGERRVKVESGDQTYHGQLSYLARMGHPVFSSDGKRLAAVSGGDVHVWNVDTGKKLRTIGKLDGAPRAIAFSPDSRLIAVAAVKSRWPIAESEITVREVSTGKVVHRLKGKNDSVSCLRFIAEGRALLIGSLQHNAELEIGTVKVWDLRENRLGNYDVYEGKAVSTIIHLPEEHAVILQSGTVVELRDVRTWNVLHTFEPTAEDESEKTRRSRFVLSASSAEAVGFSRDGTIVSAELPGEGIRSWDSRTGGVKNRIARQQAPDEVSAASSNGEFIAEATAKEVRLVDLVSGAHKVLPLQITNRISAMALSRDSRSLVTADDVGDIRIWDLTSAHVKKSFETGQEITALAIDPSGQLFAAARADRSIGLWNVATGPLQVELKKHTDVINALAFSSDGKTLASGGDDRTAILWDVDSGKVKRTLKGHDLTVTSLSFSPDGVLLASASGNASVVLWNVPTGKIERILR
ncbi:MAG TPA: WD40 repeat domain-containing protein [Pyrinomonadaceae bacterium]|nr:WD40 repeat domain-containing protein [Pyrinomonadaceae bacterium]